MFKKIIFFILYLFLFDISVGTEFKTVEAFGSNKSNLSTTLKSRNISLVPNSMDDIVLDISCFTNQRTPARYLIAFLGSGLNFANNDVDNIKVEYKIDGKESVEKYWLYRNYSKSVEPLTDEESHNFLKQLLKAKNLNIKIINGDKFYNLDFDLTVMEEASKNLLELCGNIE